MTDVLIAILLLVGASFMLLASVGVVRLPDVFTRMHATTKAATVGVGCLLIAAALVFQEVSITARAIGGVALFLATMPVAAQLIARAAVHAGAPLAERTVVNELESETELAQPPEAPE